MTQGCNLIEVKANATSNQLFVAIQSVVAWRGKEPIVLMGFTRDDDYADLYCAIEYPDKTVRSIDGRDEEYANRESYINMVEETFYNFFDDDHGGVSPKAQIINITT